MYPNNYFIHEAEQVLQQCSASGQWYILYADITDFHAINHVYGMDAGNILLQDFERYLSQCPVIEFCTRIFADLFLCLFFLEGEASIDSVMQDYDTKIQEFLEEQQPRYSACTLKIACGICTVEDYNIIKAIDGANIARKVSKKQLSTKAVLYSQAMQEKSNAQHAAEQEIYNALHEDQFCFYLQPKVDLTSGKIAGAEALARWIGKNGEIIFPNDFLPLMEETGTVIELDLMICRKVCAFLADSIGKGKSVVPISVNLSRLHIQNPGAADQLHAIATEYRIPPNLLEFELTEKILLEEFAGAKQLIDRLRSYGHLVSIDDFGSGYASINVWQELNFDSLKLDRKFLSEDNSLKKRNEAVVPNIINIAQRLQVQVLGEGVETEEQCLYLLQLGCSTVQGFYFSQPVPPEQLCKICEQQSGKYALPAALRTFHIEKTPAKEEPGAEKQTGFFRVKSYWMVLVSCTVFLCACIVSVLAANWYISHQEIANMVSETLNAYTLNQREKTIKEIERTTKLLRSLSAVFEKQNSVEYINRHLLALNENNEEIQYQYISYENLQQFADAEDIYEWDSPLVTGISGSGNLYCIAVGVPVLQDGRCTGAVIGKIKTEALNAFDRYDPEQGEIVAAFILGENAEILPIYQINPRTTNDRLFSDLEQYGITADLCTDLQETLAHSSSGARSVRAGEAYGLPYYVSVTNLKYNNWDLVICLRAGAVASHFRHIIRNSTLSVGILIAAVLLASTVLIIFIQKMQRKFTLDEQRYFLLQRFSDTVLFDYDFRRDTLRFTSNAGKFLRIHELTQDGFLKNLDQVYVYAGDREEVQQMLGGKMESHSGAIRVRLLRVEEDVYFWCLVQYHYLYEKGTLASIIGKITDIDEHMRHEDYLQKMSETDGLTGLRNKTAAEKQISALLERVSKGLLFVIDADGFKQINDQYGHATGDLALRQIGKCLQKTFHADEIIGRIGGDEMIVFTGETDSREFAVEKAAQLEQYIASGTEEAIPPCSVSIGIARYPRDGAHYADLFHAADSAMYAAKQKGKRQFCFYADI